MEKKAKKRSKLRIKLLATELLIYDENETLAQVIYRQLVKKNCLADVAYTCRDGVIHLNIETSALREGRHQKQEVCQIVADACTELMSQVRDLGLSFEEHIKLKVDKEDQKSADPDLSLAP